MNTKRLTQPTEMIPQKDPTMKETDRNETLPSELFTSYINDKTNPDMPHGDDGEDYEAKVQNGLSLLASQQDIMEEWNTQAKGELCDWLWHALQGSTDGETSSPQPDIAESDDQPVSESIEREWLLGTQYLSHFTSKLSPFELHTAATQSSIFTDGSQSHWTLCLLLCVHALRQCPSPLETRWKRWQSMLCETVRFFQNYGMETSDHGIVLWTKHVVPACEHVIRQLPPEALHVGLVSCLIGTSTTIVERENNVQEVDDANRLAANTYQVLQAVKSVASSLDEDEEWIWLHPWRAKPTSTALEIEEEEEDPDFLRNYNSISWWSKAAYKHEKVAGVDTLWDDWGVAFLALIAFDDRPGVLTPSHVWKVWFPQVSILLSSEHPHPMLGDLPMELMDKLFKCIPEGSLPSVSSASQKPDSPYVTFQLLSNRLVAKPPKKNSNQEQSIESNATVEQIVEQMKSLLSRFNSVNQVKIVRKIVHDCPHPGLKAKFMDLLRPVIFDETCEDALWSYIGSFIKNLLAYVDEKTSTLVNTDDLINNVEINVAAITMIQLWCLSKGRLPKRIKGHSLGKIRKALKKMMEMWMDQSAQSMPPDDYYRLYLLDGALHEVMRILSDAREKRKFGGGDTESLSSSSGTASADTGSPDSKGAEEVAVVGDAGIFD